MYQLELYLEFKSSRYTPITGNRVNTQEHIINLTQSSSLIESPSASVLPTKQGKVYDTFTSLDAPSLSSLDSSEPGHQSNLILRHYRKSLEFSCVPQQQNRQLRRPAGPTPRVFKQLRRKCCLRNSIRKSWVTLSSLLG